MKIIKYCKRYLLEQGFSYFIYFILSLIMAVIGLCLPILTGKFIDNLIFRNGIQSIMKYCIFITIISVSNLLFNVICTYMGVKVQTIAGYKLNKDILDYLKKVSISYTKNVDIMYLNERINNDANELIIFTMNVIVQFVINSFILFAAMILLLKINLIIACLLFGLVVLYLFVYIIFKKQLYKKVKSVKEAQAVFFSKLSEHISFIQFIKSHSLYNIFNQRLNHSFKLTLDKILSFQKIKALFFSCDSIVSTIAMILLYILGGIEILRGSLTVGYFTITTNLFNSMVSSAKYFLDLAQDYQNSLVSYNRIIELLEIPQQKEGNIVLNHIEKLEFKNVCFSYAERNIISNFSYEFYKGNIYCIVGENGAGKSTLVDLLLGLYLDEYKGGIFINDYELHQLNLSELRKKNVGVCEQEPILISDTIEMNIKLEEHNCNSYIDIDELQEKIGLKQFIYKLEDKEHTVINVQSNNLSGGEKQKISLARLFTQNPDIMIFDEPTSALDKESVYNFYEQLDKTKQDKIIILITHDYNLINDNTIILNLNNINNNE